MLSFLFLKTLSSFPRKVKKKYTAKSNLIKQVDTQKANGNCNIIYQLFHVIVLDRTTVWHQHHYRDELGPIIIEFSQNNTITYRTINRESTIWPDRPKSIPFSQIELEIAGHLFIYHCLQMIRSTTHHRVLYEGFNQFNKTFNYSWSMLHFQCTSTFFHHLC